MKQYDSIQAMRGLAAITVVFMHIQMIKNGAFGVELFFCISGFIMMHVTERGCKNFISKRVIRIVPLYWLVTFATTAILIVMPTVFRTLVFKLEFLLKTLFFIPYFYTGKSGSTANALVQVGWTLILEIFFYLIFFIAAKICPKYRHIIASTVLGVMAIVGLVVKSDNTFIRFYCQPVILEFAFGMLSYKYLTKENKKVFSTASRLVYIGTAGLIWAFLFAEKFIPQIDDVDRLIKYGIPAFVVFILLFKGLEDCKIPKFFIILGNISYSLYLTHSFVVQGFSRIIYNIDKFTVIGAVLVVFVVLPLVIGVAWISWWVIENKFTLLLRKMLIK